jgi:UDPglucose 6-dehydrogenase
MKLFYFACLMNISIIGTGYVGLVSGACFASLGHQVICVDLDTEKVSKINNSISPIYEKGLKKLLLENADHIEATTSYEKAITNSDITFICVGTPSLENGDIDLSFVDQSIKAVAMQLKNKNSFHSVVIKSTVIPGTTKNHVIPLLEKVTGKTAGKDFGVGMNPEFLREGVAVDDFLHPDRVVNGFIDEPTRKLLDELYKDFSCPIVETNVSIAEMIKYASNCFLAAKISFVNEIGNFCKNLGIDVYEVADGMGLDKRIERSFLNAGIGWGGSCFPKDTKALRSWAKKQDIPCMMIDGVIRTNDQQPLQLIKILKKHLPILKDKTISVLGLAFKPETDDIRDSRSIPLVKALLNEGAIVKVFDPQAMTHFKQLFSTITYCDNAEESLDADAILIATEWDEFKRLDYTNKLVIDGRRILEVKETAEKYEGVCW